MLASTATQNSIESRALATARSCEKAPAAASKQKESLHLLPLGAG